MNYTYKTIKNLFLQQSYLDSWEDYVRSLRKTSFIKWDYIILTASNEEQAASYRQQLQYRLDRKLLPDSTKYAVLPDPDGKRVGSGGATFNVLRYIAEQEASVSLNPFHNKRILVIHSGGDSKRVPQYSACGKLFAPVPRELPNGQASTLFDEFIIGMSGVPGRIQEGMLVVSGDVLLLFNPLQIDFQFRGAMAISIKEPVETGKNHGVFLSDGKGYVDLFLHKQSEEHLKRLGAVNEQGNVDLDTGAIALDAHMLNALYSLLCTDHTIDKRKYQAFVNERARLSFYGDFLYPLAKSATLEQYCREAAEGTICQELLDCRRQLWDVLQGFSLKLLCLSPAEFIHFGTTRELAALVTEGVNSYAFLAWKHMVMTNAELGGTCAVHTSRIDHGAVIGDGTYIENSVISHDVEIGRGCVISNVDLDHVAIPDCVALHGLVLKDGKYVVRIYNVLDNPKGKLEDNAGFLGTTLSAFLETYGLLVQDLWPDQEPYLWFAKLYPVCD
ncbi:MAG: L-fucokinase, partial [Clostridia bacterium]